MRAGFVSNSSSVTFIITNMTEKPLPLEEFIKDTFSEVSKLLMDNVREESRGVTPMLSCDWNKWPYEQSLETFIEWADKWVWHKEQRGNIMLKPGDTTIDFDNSGDLGAYYYELSDGRSKRFKWLNKGRTD